MIKRVVKITEISDERGTELVKAWLAGEDVPRERYLSREGDVWVALDNTSGDMWVEDFTTRDAAMAWLLDE